MFIQRSTVAGRIGLGSIPFIHLAAMAVLPPGEVNALHKISFRLVFINKLL